MTEQVRWCTRQPVLQACSLEGHEVQIDPYIGCKHHCHCCYALDQAETDWRQQVLTYREIVAQVSEELAGLEPDSIYMGWNSDPYQPCERSGRKTRRVLELLERRGISVCLLTKSGLVARDADLLAAMPGSSAGVSLAFQDEEVRRLFEAAAPANDERIGGLQALNKAGVSTYTLIWPVMPFLTGARRLVEMVASCTDRIWVYALSMEAEGARNWQNVQGILDRHFPEMTGPYREIAFSAAHPYWAELRHDLGRLQAESGLDLRIEL